MGYSETQQTTSKDTTGEPAFKADQAENFRTELTVAETGAKQNRRRTARGGAVRRRRAREARGPKTRNIAGDHALLSVCDAAGDWRSPATMQRHEGAMATRRHQQIVETPTEARQAEPGPSVLALLAISTGLATLILGVVWFVFFRT
jgi:hypothetical protein